jgi:hypothetical protein
MALLRTLIEPTFFVGLDSDSAYGAEADVDDARASSWILHFLVNGANAAPCGEANAAVLKPIAPVRKKRERRRRTAW